jgi:hypothetical protein
VHKSLFAWPGLASEGGKLGEHLLAHRDKDEGLG